METLAESWFVVQTQPSRERWAAENVARAGAIYYLPEVAEVFRVVIGGLRQRVFRTKPLFPRYLFVQTPHNQWHFLLHTFGVSGVVMGANNTPGTISNKVLSSLKNLERDGLVLLPKPSKFVPNQSVRVAKGIYSGYVGLVQGNSSEECVQVLFDYMGRKVSFLVNETMLEAV